MMFVESVCFYGKIVIKMVKWEVFSNLWDNLYKSKVDYIKINLLEGFKNLWEVFVFFLLYMSIFIWFRIEFRNIIIKKINDFF